MMLPVRRGFDDFGVVRVQRDERDDQFRRIAERRIEEAAHCRAGAEREFFGGVSDEPCRGHE